jgi:hypothetical protein
VPHIFFSYSSVDRERVRPIRDALVALGFEAFWDQQVPTGLDWHTWIRQHLTKSGRPIAAHSWHHAGPTFRRDTTPVLFSARPIAKAPEPSASRHVLPKDLAGALKRLDNAEIDAPLAAVTERPAERGKASFSSDSREVLVVKCRDFITLLGGAAACSS